MQVAPRHPLARLSRPGSPVSAVGSPGDAGRAARWPLHRGVLERAGTSLPAAGAGAVREFLCEVSEESGRGIDGGPDGQVALLTSVPAQMVQVSRGLLGFWAAKASNWTPASSEGLVHRIQRPSTVCVQPASVRGLLAAVTVLSVMGLP